MTDIGNASEQQDMNSLDVQEQDTTASSDAGNAPSPSETPSSDAPASNSEATQDQSTDEQSAGDVTAASVAPKPEEQGGEAAISAPADVSEVSSAPSSSDAPATESAGEPAASAPVESSPAVEATADAVAEGTENAAPASEGDAPAEAASGEETSDEGGGSRGGRGRRAHKMPEEQMREIWTELAGKRDANEEIELDVISHNRGGVVAQYKGLEVFIPMSHWSLDKHSHSVGADAKTGEAVNANILEMTEFETDARRVTATRRAVLRRELLTSLEVGQRLTGRVTSILDFGIFVDLGGIDGLVHASEISHAHAKHPGEQVTKGDEVEVIIREIDRDRKRIYLGMKELLPSPWDHVEESYPVGSTQHGKVVGLSKAGAFIELEPGIDGFVRLRELSWTKRVQHPKEVLKKGMEVDVKVLDASAQKQRLSLSYRQAQEDPWPGIVEKYSIGTRWEGEVREISNKGVVVSVGDVEGFLPRGRMGREAKKLPDMKAGDKLNVHVVDIDPKGLSLIFGLSTHDDERGGGGRGESHGEGGRGRDRDRDRDRTAPPVQPENELKQAGNVGSFSIGDMIGEAIKQRLNFDAPEKAAPAKQPAAQESAPVAIAPVAEPVSAPEAPAPAQTEEPTASVAAPEAPAPVQTEEPTAPESTTPVADEAQGAVDAPTEEAATKPDDSSAESDAGQTTT